MIKQLFSLILLLIHLILTNTARHKEQKISDINVLLPSCDSENCNKVYYTVHAEGGCYEWSVDKPGYIDLTPLQGKEEMEGCHHKVEISPMNGRVKNEIVWLIARDRKSNEQFRCKVGFGKINRLQIEKSFQKMNLNEITKINVNAFDEDNNMFSSVKGFRFHWKINDGNIVQLLKLSQEKIKVGVKRIEVEKKFHSDIILLKGVNTGKVILTAEILEEDYKGITSDQRKLYVIEPFQIYPTEELYVLPNNKFNFDLELIYTSYKKEDNPLIFVPVQNHHFYNWKLLSNECGTIRGFGEYQSNFNICTTKVTAEDTRIDQYNKAENTIHVVNPTAIDVAIVEISNQEADLIFSKNLNENEKLRNYKTFEILHKNEYDNSNTWKLVEGRNYLIKNILMHERHPIMYSLNSIKFNIDFTNLNEYFQSFTCLHENEICLLITKRISKDFLTLESKFKTLIQEKETEYQITKNVKIYSQVRIEKFGRQIFSLPYLGYRSKYESEIYRNDTIVNTDFIKSQELHLIVNGGTRNYIFQSENSDVIQIREEILLGKLQGKTRVKVTDSEIPNNFDHVEVEVREVKDFSYLEERQEIPLNSEFYITPIAIKTTADYDETQIGFYTNNVFTNCTNLYLNSTLGMKDRNIKQIETSNKSNYQKVKSFLENNKNLLIQKLSWMKIDPKEEDNQNLRYLNYINYGVCDSKGFIAEHEGIIRVSFITLINQIGKNVNKIMSSFHAKVYVYSPISLISPKFEDIFTRELLNKANIQDPLKNKIFVLAVGSGVNVRFSGGIIPWAEYGRSYVEDIHLYESNKNRTSSLELIRDQLSVKFNSIKEYLIECIKENEDREIVITMRNEKDKTLPRPASTSVSITIACQYPKFLSIFFLGTNLNQLKSRTNMIKDEASNDVFSVPQNEGIEYYEKKNSIELTRVYAFDGNKRIFYNITSLTGEWSQKNSVRNKNLFQVLSDKDLKKYGVDEMVGSFNFNQPEYFHYTILFENDITKFDLNYRLKTGLNHFVSINLIDFPTLSPHNTTAYLSHDNIIEVEIQNGSGDFEISVNDPSLVSYEYSPVDRKIYLTPIKQGVLYVYVKDNKINSQFRAIATIYLSDIKKIQLIGGGLLMVNNTMNITMKVYDFFGNIFSPDQVSKMNLRLGDVDHISKGLHFSFEPKGKVNVEKFTLQGTMAHLYSIYVKDMRTNLVSNELKVEVFDRLEVFPPTLLMIPGSAYTLSIRGGPVNEQHIIKKYEMVNQEIATVDPTEPEVKAHLVGKTVLRIILALNPDYNKFYMIKEENIEEGRSIILAIEEVNVTVDFPDSVTIRGAVNRKIYTKSSVRIFAAFKLGDETFTYGTGPFNFDWALDNTLIAKFRFYKSIKKECSTKASSEECKETSIMTHRNINPLNALGVFLTTQGQGTIDIKLTVTVNYPNPYQWRRPNVFTRHEKILIQDEIYVDIPEFYENIPNKSSMYLIPLDVDHELQTNKNNNFVKYSLISQHGAESDIKEHVVNLQDTGRITTFHQTGMAHVLINQRDKENPAFIPVVLPVYVLDFYSLFAERSYQLIDMEIGQEVYLKVILQHEYGILFASGKFERFKLRVVESHPRVARAELTDHNSNIKIRANSKGETNIILFHPRTMQILDVFQVTVYSSLNLPKRISLNVGATIDFLKKDDKRKLYLSQDSDWISDDPSILAIDRVTGMATALKEGRTNVHLISKDKTKVKLSTTVNVVRVKKATIDRSKIPPYLTDIKTSQYYQSEYKVPVNFYFDDNSEELTTDIEDDLNEIDQKINFKCISNNPEIFTAESITDNIRQCVIRIRDIPFNLKAPNNLDLIISVESQGEKSYDTYSYKSSFKIPFTSQFKIKNKVKEITLTKNNRTAMIYVDNLKDVNVDIEDEDLFKKEINTEDEEENYIKLYVPHNVTKNFNDLRLTLKNKMTNQKEEILLNYVHSEEAQVDRLFYGLIRRDTLIDFLTLVVLVVTIWILYNYLTGSQDSQRKIIPGPNVSASRPPQGSGITSAFNMNK